MLGLFHWFYEQTSKKWQASCKVYDSIINMAYLKKKIDGIFVTLFTFYWNTIHLLERIFVYQAIFMIHKYIYIYIGCYMKCIIYLYGCVLFGLVVVWFVFTQSPLAFHYQKVRVFVRMWNLWFSTPFPSNVAFVYIDNELSRPHAVYIL